MQTFVSNFTEQKLYSQNNDFLVSMIFNTFYLFLRLSQESVWVIRICITLLIILILMSSSEKGIITPKTMYEYDHHTNIPWNDPEYQPVREYLDPNRQMSERKYLTQKKGDKDNRYLTRKGFYMDYHLKVVKALPAPCAHNLGDPWDQTDNKKQGAVKKIDPKLSKFTYLDRIAMEQKNRKTPAPGSYNLNKTDSQIKQELQKMKTKKFSHEQKRYFYEDTEFLSNRAPGPGMHNPHDQVPNLHMNKTDHKFWIGKHKKDSQYWKKKRSSVPGPSSYDHIPLEYDTFHRIYTSEKKRKKSQSKNGFGSDAKFTYQRPNKKKIIQTRPAPCTYSTQIEWKGKNMDARKNNWVRTRSTGFNTNRSVYH